MADSYDWVVEKILPAREIHLIAGPSGAGKTTWIYQTIPRWQRGEPFFGYKSYPAPFVYLSLDRSQEGMNRTLKRVGVAEELWPRFIGARGANEPKLEILLTRMRQNLPGLKVAFIDGMARYAPSAGKSNDYQAVARWLCDLGEYCRSNGLTILGIVHSPKRGENERYDNPRQRILGSVAWAAFVETIILVEPADVDNPTGEVRQILLLPRNEPPQKLLVAFDGSGLLVPVEKAPSVALMLGWVKGLGDGSEFKTEDAIDYGTKRGLSRRIVELWLKSAVEDGYVTKVSHGQYRASWKV